MLFSGNFLLSKNCQVNSNEVKLKTLALHVNIISSISTGSSVDEVNENPSIASIKLNEINF